MCTALLLHIVTYCPFPAQAFLSSLSVLCLQKQPGEDSSALRLLGWYWNCHRILTASAASGCEISGLPGWPKNGLSTQGLRQPRPSREPCHSVTSTHMAVSHGRKCVDSHRLACVYPLVQCLCGAACVPVCERVRLLCPCDSYRQPSPGLTMTGYNCSQGDDTITVAEMRVSWAAPAATCSSPLPRRTHCPCTKTHCLTCAPYVPALPGLPSDSSTHTSGSSYRQNCVALGPSRALAFTQLEILALDSGPPE